MENESTKDQPIGGGRARGSEACGDELAPPPLALIHSEQNHVFHTAVCDNVFSHAHIWNSLHLVSK